MRHHHIGLFAAVLLVGVEIHTNNVTNMNAEKIPTVHLTRLVLPKNVLTHVKESRVEGEQNAKLNNTERFAIALGAYKEIQ